MDNMCQAVYIYVGRGYWDLSRRQELQLRLARVEIVVDFYEASALFDAAALSQEIWRCNVADLISRTS